MRIGTDQQGEQPVGTSRAGTDLNGSGDDLKRLEEAVRERLGLCPSFFKLAQGDPDIAWNLWRQAEFAYIDSPLPSLFKEKLFTYLSRFCNVRYCVARHCAFLLGLGRPAGDPESRHISIDEALALLSEPFPGEDELQGYLSALEDAPAPLENWPEFDTVTGMSFYVACAVVFLYPSSSELWLKALHMLLGPQRYEQLMMFLAFVRTANFWTQAHPDLAIEEDIEQLLRKQQVLADRLLNDPEARRGELSSHLYAELQELRKTKDEADQLRQLNDQLQREAIERQRVEESLKARAEQQKVVAQLGQMALEGISLNELMQKVTEQVANTLGVEYCKVLELLLDHKALLLRAGVGWRPGLVGHATVGTEMNSQAGYTLSSDMPVIVEDLRTEERFSGSALLIEHNVISGMSVIIEGSDGPFGVLGTHTTRFRIFTVDDVNFLQAVANILATAIERRRTEDALRRANESLSLAQRASSSGVWDWNVVTGAVYWSPEHKALYGLDDAIQPSYENWIAAIHPEDRERINKEHSLTLQTPGADWKVEFRIKRPVRGERWLASIGAVERDAEGRPLRMSGITIDITDQKRIDELRDSIISMVSHELRTPIHHVRGYSSSLIQDDIALDEETRLDFLQGINQEANRLGKLVSNIMETSRLGSGGLSALNLVPVYPEALIQSSLEDGSFWLQEHQLSVNVPEGLPPVLADPECIKLVLSNLLDNAAKYSPSGSHISVSARLGQGDVVFSVEDEGPGIPEEERERIFERFTRLYQSGAPQVPGTGLGLAICRMIISSHKGRIWLDSKPTGGGGSVFSFILPVAPGQM